MLSILLLFSAFGCLTCAAFAGTEQTETVQSTETFGARLLQFFRDVLNRLKQLWERFVQLFRIKKEPTGKTMNQNAIHMLQSVTDTIGDSFIITTEDGKVIVIDGGHYSETNYFLKYLKAVTGQKKPHIDAWFLSHPHDDHCEVFLDVVENHADEVSFDQVMHHFAPVDFYTGADEWADTVLHEYQRLLPAFAEKERVLQEGDVFSVGAATFTVFYTFDPAFTNCNESSLIFRMDLAGTSVMFTGDAGAHSGHKVLQNWQDSGLLDCDYCKMSHHGQDGLDREFYAAVAPEVRLWPTPSWVWENTGGNLTTFETRAWVEELHVKSNYKSFEGSQVIRMKPRMVTTSDVFEDGYPAQQAIDRLAALGYDAVDMGFDYWVFDSSPFLGDDYLDWARSLKAHADEKGVAYTHAHAPGEANSEEWVRRSIEATAAIGARYLVVHPVWRDEKGNTITNKRRFIQINAEAIREWLPLAEEKGVVLLSENILWGASADPRIISELVQTVNSDWFGWCFDVGHAWCSGYQPDVLKKCAVTPMPVHIQDNDGSGDGHLIPGDGTINWETFTKALNDVGYLGDCVLEAHHQSLDAPDNERDAILARLLEQAGPIQARLSA